MEHEDPTLLSDEQLLLNLERFVEDERARLPRFLAWLGEADRRKALTRGGYSSTFDYCVRRLKLSEDEAYRRIHAARATIVRPEMLAALSDGKLTLSAISKLAPHVERADAAELISLAEGKTKRQVEELLAPLSPVPVKRDLVRAVAIVIPAENDLGLPSIAARVDFSFQGSPELRDAIERAKDLLSHKFPSGQLDDVLLEIVHEYLSRHDPQRALEFGKVGAVKGSSSLPAPTRRAVWARDGGRCAYCGPDGTRCESRCMLEIDHRIPRALGGSDEVGNLRLLCRPHNDSERRRLLGEGIGQLGPGQVGPGSSRWPDQAGATGATARTLGQLGQLGLGPS